MISKYLKTKNLISQIKPTINEDDILSDCSESYYYLNLFDCNSTYYYYRNLFTEYELQRLIATANKLEIRDGVVSNNKLNIDIRDSKISWIPVNSQTNWIYEKITWCINEVNKNYFEYDLTKLEKLQFTRYYGEENSFYGKHIDSNFGYLYENRKLTFVMQLSDPNEYEGGELKLFLGREPDIIPKERGLITFFPAHTLHECTPVTLGTRYSLVGWVHGPKLK